MAILFRRKRQLAVWTRHALLWKKACSPDVAQIRHDGSFCSTGRLRLYLAAILLFLLVVTAKAASGSATLPTALAPAAPNAHFAIADLDGDSQPDLASVQIGQVTAAHARYWIHLQLSSGGRQFIGVTAPVGGLELALRDVNGDQNLDLIVTTAWLKRPVAVLLNDGHGNFTLRDPATFAKAVSDGEGSCSAGTLQITDAAAVFPRAGGDCEPGRAGSSTPRSSRRLRLTFTHPPACSPSLAVFGRGPPYFVNHD